jgi:integrase
MLTDTKCRNAKPAGKPYKLADGKGLYLEVKPNGVKAWRYRFELSREGARKESLFAIGNYANAPAGETEAQTKARRDGGCFTLAEAREERARVRALVKQGINPAHNRRLLRVKREQETATTFEAVAREWVAAKDWEEATKTRRLDMLERVVFPKIGALPVKQVNPTHVLDVLKTAAKKNGPSVAAEAKRAMSGVFELAVSTLRADADPVFPVRKALPTNKTQHRRPLTIEEIGRLLRDLAGYERNFQTVAAFRLMWLTLCRPNEVMGARWDEIDFDSATWRIPAARMKRRQEHLVPLPWQAVELLRAVQGVTGHRGHVFPHRDDRGKSMTDATLRQALAYLGWSGKYSPHATRATGSTRLNEMGYAADWIERQLAHAEPNAVRRTYNHADYMVPRVKMMQQWADMLDSWRNGAKVLPLRTTAA